MSELTRAVAIGDTQLFVDEAIEGGPTGDFAVKVTVVYTVVEL